MKRVFAVIAALFFLLSLSPAQQPPAEKTAPKLTVKYGMTPAQAIRAATSDAADLLGRSTDVGFVMKGGVVYKDTLTGKSK